jgi:PAS domain S-box-containing protein
MATTSDTRILEAWLDSSAEVLCVLDAQGRLLRASAACGQLLGHEPAALAGQSFASLVVPADRPALAQAGLAGHFTCQCLCQQGPPVSIAWAVSQVAGGPELLAVGRALPAAPEPRPLNHVLIEQGFDMVAVLDRKGVYTYVGGATERILGYRPEDMLGRQGLDFVHPEDLPAIRASLASLCTQAVLTMPEFRFRAANGEWKWLQSTASSQLTNPEIQAFTLSSRDVTEQRRKECELAKSEQRFRLLFDNDLTLTTFQTADGRVLDANQALLTFLKKEKHELLDRTSAEFLPADVRDLFREKHALAASGQRVRFETQVRLPGAPEQTLKVTKTPLIANGEVVGIHCGMQDITAMAAAQHLIKRQAEQLTTILESLTDAFFSLDKNMNFTYLNRETERLLGVNREKCLGKNIWDLFPDELDSPYFYNYVRAAESGQTRHFEAFFKPTSSWFEVKAFPSTEGLSVYFSDITDRLESDRQIERLALVARKTDNGVIITDAQGRIDWVNESFTKHTGYTLAEVVAKTPGSVLQGPETDPATVEHIRTRMTQRRPFSATLLNYKKSGKKVWFSMDITPVYDESGQLTQFIALLQNITYRKEIEASQAKMTQDLYRQNRDLQQFAYVISHNLRGPLSNALGLASLLGKSDKHAGHFDNTLGLLSQSMTQVDTVLKDLNTVLSIRDQQDVQQPELVLLADVCQQALHDLRDALHQCGGQVHLTGAEGVRISGNRAYLYSIFYNLLSNAIKYRSPDRLLAVTIHCASEKGSGACISFADNGSGFDTYKAGSEIFQLYKRFHTNQRGRGIGLFLVKTHVEAMGGKIEVTSAVDAGTRFVIHLDPR